MSTPVITKKFRFYAAHRNIHAGMKCGRLHGHTYHLEVMVCKEPDPISGVTILFAEIDQAVEKLIWEKLDHYTLLYQKDPLATVFDKLGESYTSLPFETSVENVTKYIFEQLVDKLPMFGVKLSETESSLCTYIPDTKEEAEFKSTLGTLVNFINDLGRV